MSQPQKNPGVGNEDSDEVNSVAHTSESTNASTLRERRRNSNENVETKTCDDSPKVGETSQEPTESGVKINAVSGTIDNSTQTDVEDDENCETDTNEFYPYEDEAATTRGGYTAGRAVQPRAKAGTDVEAAKGSGFESGAECAGRMVVAEANADKGCLTPQRRITLNVLVLSVAYLLLFTAFKGATNLQSSVNAEGGRGTSALMAYYAAFIGSSIFLPAVMINKLGCKWTMALCAAAYAPFMAANLRPEFYTLVPGALVAGAGAGPAWCAICTYASLAGERRARPALGGDGDVEAATAHIYSLFYTVYQLNQVSGNLISSLLLSAGLDPTPVPEPTLNSTWPPMLTPSSVTTQPTTSNPNNTSPIPTLWTTPTPTTPALGGRDTSTVAGLAAPEATTMISRRSARSPTMAPRNATGDGGGEWEGPGVGVCGASLCGDAATSTPMAPPPPSRITALCAVYLVCVLMAAALLAFGVQNLKRKDVPSEQPSALQLLVATLRLLRRRRLLLLVPVFFFFGAEKAFVGAEFTAGYVSCVSGVGSIGYVMICYGLTNSAASAAAGWLKSRVGRRRLLGATLALHGALLAVLLAWQPRPAAPLATALLFPLAAVWGVVDGLWLVQINSLVSLLFPGEEEAAFSNYHLWESGGYILAYGYSAHLCIYVKLYILVALLGAGTAAYAAIEVLHERRKRRKRQAEEQAGGKIVS